MDPTAAARPLGESMTRRQKVILLGSLMVSMFLGALDQTIVSTATPTILSDLGGFELFSWMFTGFMLSSTVVVPLAGKLSDVYGRKPFLLAGIIIFVVASALCGAAWDMTSLIVFRVIQGAGGGLIFSSVFATVGDLFSPAERGRYMGIFTGTFSLASVLGPTLGGFITDSIGWRWIFYLNVPVAAVAIPAIWFALPSRPSVRRPSIDFVGATLLGTGAVALLLALTWAGVDYAWSSPQIIGLLVLAGVLTVLFVFQELRHPEPVLPLFLLKNREFVLANLIVVILGISMFGLFPYLPTFVQVGLDQSATSSGVIATPQSLGVLLTSIIGGNILASTGKYKGVTIFGAVMMCLAIGLLQVLDETSALWHVSAVMVVLGIGMGAVMPTMSLVVQNAVSYQYLGVATSASQFFRQIGGVFGAAIFGTILTRSYANSFKDGAATAGLESVPQPLLDQFSSDATVALNESTFAQLQASILALPGGEALLTSAVAVQRVAITDAMHTIAWISLGVAFIGLVFALLLKELPLRRQIGGEGTAQATPQPGAALQPGTAALPEAAPQPDAAGQAPGQQPAVEPGGGGG